MAASPKWKLYSASNAYVASSHDLVVFAASIGVLNDGATVRLGHSKKSAVWTEGSEEFRAYESYDGFMEVCQARAIEVSA